MWSSCVLQDIYYRFQQQVPVACPPVLVTTTKRLLGRAAPPAKNRQPCLHPLLCLVQRSPSLATSAALAFRLLLRRANLSHLRALALAIPSALHVLLPDPHVTGLLLQISAQMPPPQGVRL